MGAVPVPIQVMAAQVFMTPFLAAVYVVNPGGQSPNGLTTRVKASWSARDWMVLVLEIYGTPNFW